MEQAEGFGVGVPWSPSEQREGAMKTSMYREQEGGGRSSDIDNCGLEWASLDPFHFVFCFPVISL